MAEKNREQNKQVRAMYSLALANVVIWAVAIIAIVFLIQEAPSAKKLFPILGGGMAVGVALLSKISKVR